jgi:hypothetical protein
MIILPFCFVPPLYVSLKIHDMTLHNAMLESRASHNMMKVVDWAWTLQGYKDLSFDSRNVLLIKDLMVSLSQIHDISLLNLACCYLHHRLQN